MKKLAFTFLSAFVICLVALTTLVYSQTVLTSNSIGTHDGYDYEFWRDSLGFGNMTLGPSGTFSCEWGGGVNNILFRKGRKFDETRTHQQIGNISVVFDVDYHPVGNSYLCVYGWTVDPLVEFYIVDNWGTWRPPGATSLGTFVIDGGTYDIYETTRTQQPSIRGTQTFQQYWSVRREGDRRSSGTISVSRHFEEWERRGMEMGRMYEVALTIEGWQSSGRATVTVNDIIIGGATPPPPAPAFTLGLNPATGSVAAGSSVTTAATITPQNGLTGNVTFSLVSPPAGITLSGGPVNVTGTSAVNANLSIAVAAGAAAGARTVTVRATAGTVTREVTYNLTVTAPPTTPAFTFGLSPATGSVAAGSSVTTAATITPQNGLTGNVTFSLVSPPAGITLSGGPVNVTGTSAVNANLSIAVAAGTAAGARTITVRAISGTVTREVTYSLTVTAPPPPPVTIPGRVEAESYSAMLGIQVEPDAGGVLNVGWVNPGDWTRYSVNVSEMGSYVMRMRVATGATANGNIVVRNQAGATLGTLIVDAARSNGWHDWYVDSIIVDLSAGLQELTLEFTGAEYLFNIDWFELSPITTSVSVMREFETQGYSVWVAPNPAILGARVLINTNESGYANVSVFNIRGKKVLENDIFCHGDVTNTFDLDGFESLPQGIYYIVLSTDGVKRAIRSVVKIQ